MSTFTLHPQLLADTHHVCELATCRVLLMDDVRFPWLILVPRIAHARELHQLSDTDYDRVNQEIRQCASALEKLVEPHKMNVAALGNQVEQLHIHVVARFKNDAAWPAPIWGLAGRATYPSTQTAEFVERLSKRLIG